ncbi:MAG: Sporulation initiation inhibitor protein Soj [Firmicutes bacterium ADurb.Bin506]|nr:MAG: Sporulation initiation inhibitor protein Soj [Firmicutes bacterium ADurb.Bin506]
MGGMAVGKVMAVVNQKGGTAKTTTTVNVGAYLAMAGRRVLLVDMDPQGNATSGLGIDKRQVKHCIYNVLIDDTPLASVMMRSCVEGLEIVPATLNLAGAEIELVSLISREHRLKNALADVRAMFDYVLIDCPPSLGLLTLNALTAADSALVPIQCEFYALEGLSQLLRTIEMVRKHLNPGLAIEGIVLTMHDSRTNLSQQVVEDVRRNLSERVFDTAIPRNVRLSEAPSYGLPIPLYDDKSRGAEAYRSLAGEIMSREGA